jgi:ABC-type bacteriocin/lantibiotic exporter with double-glycine peptidase domain
MFHWTRALALAVCLAGGLFAAESAVWIDVPFIKQEKNGCGAASIAMVIQYWQRQQALSISADPGQIQQELYSRKAHGIYASDLQRYFDQHGFRTFAFHGEWKDLIEHLQKGRPLIVGLRPLRQSEFHYVVVAGIDDARGLVLVNDPAQRKLLKLERSTFEKEWKVTDNWTLLVVPAQKSTAQAQP